MNGFPKTLADFTSPALMVPQLRTATPASVIAELSAILEREELVPDAAAFCRAVLVREQMSSTATPLGWALPHARINGLPQLSFALARSSRPFVWSPESRAPVYTVFLFAVPELEAKTYLNLISAVARLSQSPGLLAQLRGEPDAGAMFAVLQQVALRPPRSVPASPIGSYPAVR